MNRKQRRAATIRDSNGNKLEAMLAHIVERDALGRPTILRLAHDDETVGEVVGAKRRDVSMILLWVPPEAVKPKAKADA